MKWFGMKNRILRGEARPADQAVVEEFLNILQERVMWNNRFSILMRLVFFLFFFLTRMLANLYNKNGISVGENAQRITGN